MALSLTSNYAGIAASEFISPALLNATTIANEYVTIHTGIKFKFNLLLWNDTNMLQADGCSFNAQGDINLTESVIQPVHLKVNTEFCKTTLESHWMSEQMRAGALNSDVPTTFASYLTKRVQGKIAEQIERLIWEGKISGSTGIYATDPYLKLTTGLWVRGKAAATRQIAGAAIDGSNAIAEIGKVYDRISDKIFDNPSLKIFVPRQVFRAYQQALPSTYVANSNFDITKPQPTMYKGLPLVFVGLANNHIVASIKENLHVGTDLTGDFLEYRILDMSMLDGSDNIRIKMRFSLDTQITNPDEIVIYGNSIA